MMDNSITHLAGEAPADFVDRWDDEFYQQWGKIVGRMHEASRSYTPPSERYKRPHWYQTDDVAVEKYVAADDTGVMRASMKVIETLRQLPTKPESYGLIHGDLHRRNFLVKDGVLTVFDFGSCQYCWFSYDIAVCVYHAVFSTPKGMQMKDFGDHFLEQFIRGYEEVNSTCEIWLDKIPLFLKLRRIVMYLDMLRYWDLASLSPDRKQFLQRHHRDIEADTSVL
jgi:Ser/Thr protein kinase RdoA (MazF antagonist)